MARIAIIVGHNSRSRGAVRSKDGITEYDWNSSFAEKIEAFQPDLYMIVKRQPGQSYGSEIREAYSHTDGCEATVELHFNAAVASATGTETLSSGTSGSLKLCNLLQDGMVGALGLPDRGVKMRQRDDRGGLSLWVGAAPAALIEPYFGSNDKDCEVADASINQLALAIHNACLQYLGEPACGT